MDGRYAESLIAGNSRNGNRRIDDGSDPCDRRTICRTAPLDNPMHHAGWVEIVPDSIDKQAMDTTLRIVKPIRLCLDVALRSRFQFSLHFGGRFSRHGAPNGFGASDNRDGLRFVAPAAACTLCHRLFEHGRRGGAGVGAGVGGGRARGGAPAARGRGEERSVAAQAGQAFLHGDGAQVRAGRGGLRFELGALGGEGRALALRRDFGRSAAVEGKGALRAALRRGRDGRRGGGHGGGIRGRRRICLRGI